MKLKKTFIPLLTLFTLLTSCNNVNNPSTSESESESVAPTEANYSVEYYFESLIGDYFINEQYTITETDDIGSKITAEIKSFEGFTYDEDNENNITSLVLSDSVNELKVYYSRNEYNLTVLGGTATKDKVKYEEKVTITPNVVGAEIIMPENALATLEGNELTMGAEDLTIKCLTTSKIIISDEKFTAKENFSAQVNINIQDSSNIDGLVFSYVSNNMSPTGSETYYVFGTAPEGLGLYLYNNGSLDALKKTSLPERLTGSHIFSVKVGANNVIRCYVDGVESITATSNDFALFGLTPINSVGRIGVFSNKYFFSYTDLLVTSGVLTLNQAKGQILKTISTFTFSQHKADFVNYRVDEGDVQVNYTATSYGSKFAAIQADINSATSVEDIDRALEGVYELKLQAQKEYTKEHLFKLLDDIHHATLLFYAEEKETLYYDTNIVLTRDYLDRDLRVYVPDAYKLYGEEGSICLLDQFDIDLLNASTTEEVYALSDKYALDLVRALCFKDYEYYYWEQYHKYPGATYPEWDWFLYNYCGAAGNGFVYIGNVFENYKWEKDFRLTKALYGTKEMGAASTIFETLDFAGYMMKAQTIKEKKYTITLNTDGGTLANTQIATTSAAAYTLPVPTKAGYSFDGWYYNRVLQGTAITDIPAGNTANVTLYAAWKSNGSRVKTILSPAEYITENMVIQQNKPIIFSGTGSKGITVDVSFNGVNKSTTVAEDGTWNVIFDAIEGSFIERTLTISSGDVVYTFNNVLVGEVWLGAGQSNMEMLPVWLNNRGLQEVGKGGQFHNFSKIRIFRQFVDTYPTDYEDNNIQNRWAAPVKMSDLFDKSLLGFSFACSLQEKLNVPVGILTSAVGGTYIEEWLSQESLQVSGTSLAGETKTLESRFYDTMTVDLKGMQISGVIWYQGCNNWATPELYKPQFGQLIKQYREEIFFNANLPVIVQQLVQFNHGGYESFRLMQWELMNMYDNVYTSSGIDTGEEMDIHPADKYTLARRMARIAGEYVYGVEQDSLSYVPTKVTRENGKVVVHFKEGQVIKATGAIKHLKLMDAYSGQLLDTTSKIVGNTIVIDDITGTSAVFYAHAPYLGEINLYGGNDLPVAPFAMFIQ